jgi:hypothetical protein
MAGGPNNQVTVAPAKAGPTRDDKKIDVKSDSGFTSEQQKLRGAFSTFFDPWKAAWGETFGNPNYVPPILGPAGMAGPPLSPETLGSPNKTEMPTYIPMPETDRAASAALRGSNMQSRRQAMTDAAIDEQPTPVDWLAKALEFMGPGPNYEEYRQKLAEEVMRTNARAAAMYKELAKENEANVKRAKDIYTEGGSDLDRLYRQAEADVAGAYEQAAKARGSEAKRLGIEEAFAIGAPAESRAQGASVADLVKGRAAGLGRMAEVGTAAAGRANEMGGVYQQRGGEYQQAQLDQLNAQLLNNLFQQEQQMYNARLQAPGLAQQLYQASQLGIPQAPTYDQQLKAQQRAEEALVKLRYDIANGIAQTTGRWPDAATVNEAYNALIGQISG